MNLDSLHKKLSQGYLPSVEKQDDDRWHVYEPSLSQGELVAKKLTNTLQAIFGKLSTETCSVADRLKRFSEIEVLKSDVIKTKLTNIPDLLEQINNQRKRELAALMDQLSEALNSERPDVSALRLGFSHLLHAEEIRPKEVEALLGQLDAKVEHNIEFGWRLAYSKDTSRDLQSRLISVNPKIALYEAIHVDPALAIQLIEEHPDWVNTVVNSEGTFLALASRLQKNKVCNSLLSHGASVESLNQQFRLPMNSDYKTRFCSVASEHYLKALIPDSLELDQQTASLQRIFKDLCLVPNDSEYGKSRTFLCEVLDFVATQGLDWAGEHPNLMTIWLSHAILYGVSSEKLIKYLTAFSFCLDEHRGMNLLRMAIAHERADIVENLLQSGVEAGRSYEEPLLWTQADARVDARNRSKPSTDLNTTPLDQALALKNLKIAQILLHHCKPKAPVANDLLGRWVTALSSDDPKSRSVELSLLIAEAGKLAAEQAVPLLASLCESISDLEESNSLMEKAYQLKTDKEELLTTQVGKYKSYASLGDREKKQLRICADVLAQSRIGKFTSTEQKAKIGSCLKPVLQACDNKYVCKSLLTGCSHAFAEYLSEKNPFEVALYAVENNDPRLLETLLQKEKNRNDVIDAFGGSLLRKALEDPYDSRIAEVLIEFGASLDSINEEYITPLNSRRPVEGTVPCSKVCLEHLVPASLPQDLRPDFEALCLWNKNSFYPPSGRLEKILSVLCQPEYVEWVEKHPNLVTLWLVLAIKQMPSAHIATLLPHFRQIVSGPAGESFLYQAVEMNRGEVVDVLIHLGVKGSVPYSRKEILQRGGFLGERLGKQPLVHALWSSKTDAALALIRNAGIPIKQVFDEVTRSIRDNEKDHFWRLILKNLPNRDLLVIKKKEERFTEALKNFDWIEINYWIDQGLSPQDAVGLASKALEKGQWWFVEMLRNRGFLAKISEPMLCQIASCRDQSWARVFLNRLHAQGIEIRSKRVLDAAASKGHIETAAMLVTLGAPFNKAMPHAGEIQNLCSHLSGTDAECRFRLQLTDKNLAHLVGDSFVKKMQGDGNYKLEGNTHAESLTFLQTALEYASEKSKQDLSRVIHVFERARAYAVRFDGLFAKDKVASGIADFENDILKDLNPLAEGESLMIPGGWVTGQNFSHAITYVFTTLPDGATELQVVNTGEGIEFHAKAHDRARMHVNTINRYHFPPGRLEESHTLRALLEIMVAGGQFLASNRRYRPEDVYSLLAPYQIGEEVSVVPEGSHRKAQLSGTCSMRCYLAYLKSKLAPDVYKALKSTLNEDAITFAVEQYEPYLAQRPSLTKLLSLAVPHLFDTLGKDLKNRVVPVHEDFQRLSNLEGTATRLKEAIPTSSSVKASLSLAPVHKTQTNLIRNTLSGLSKKKPINEVRVEKKEVSPLSAWDSRSLESIKSATNLLQHLQQLHTYATTLTDEDRVPCLTTGLCSLGRLFLNPSHPPTFEPVFDELRNDSAACARLLNELVNLTNALQKLSSKQSPQIVNPARFLAMNFALVVGWQLVTLIEAKNKSPAEACVEHYGLTDIHLTLFQYQQAKSHVLLNAEWEQDYNLLLNAGCWSSRESRPKLFNFPEQQVIAAEESAPERHYKLALTPKHAEFLYAKAVRKDHNDWIEADAQLKDLLETARRKMREEPVVDSEAWRTNWLFASRQLPAYFYQLRMLMIGASSDTIGSAPPSVAYLRRFDFGDLSLEMGQELGPSTRSMRPCCSVARKGQQGPKDAPSLPEGLHKEPENFSEELFLKVYSQNALSKSYNPEARKLMSVRYGVTEAQPAGTVGVLLLLDEYDKQLDLLADTGQRSFFEFNLFSPGRLPLLLEQLPSSGSEIEVFFNRAILHFQDRIATAEDVTTSVQAHLFLLNQHARFLNYCFQNGLHTIEERSVVDLIRQTRAQMRQLLKQPAYAFPESQKYLQLMLMDSFQASQISGKEDLETLLLSTAAYRLLEVNQQMGSKLTPAFINSAKSVPYSHAEQLQFLLQKYPERRRRIFGQMVGSLGIQPSKKAQWEEKAFPVYSCQMDKNTRLTINVLTGVVKKNGEALGEQNNWIWKNELYQKLFGDQKLVFSSGQAKLGSDKLNSYESSDAYGKVILYESNYHRAFDAYRELDDTWYSYVDPKKSPPHPLLPGSNNWVSWCSQDDGSYLFVDRSTMKPKMTLDKQGYYRLAQDDFAKAYEWVDLANVDGEPHLLSMDKEAFLLQEVSKKSPRTMMLVLPSLSLDGEALQFMRQKPEGMDQERWVLQKMPHFFLSLDQTLPELRDLSNFLIIETTSGEKEALLPLKSYEQLGKNVSMEASCIRVGIAPSGKLISQTPEKSAYLAYLAVTHAKTPEDYQQAMKHLQDARKFDRYNDEELRILGQLMLNPRETTDHTPYGYACRFYVSWLVHDNFQRNPATHENSKTAPSWPTFNTGKEDWRAFWQNTYSYQKNKNQADKTQKTMVKTIAQRYFERSQHLPHNMRIENLLSARELMEWDPVGLLPQRLLDTIVPSALDMNEVQNPKDFPWGPETSTQSELVTRPEEGFTASFINLLGDALSSNEQRRIAVADILRNMNYDRKPDVVFGRVLLDAALDYHSNGEAQALIDTVLAIISGESKVKVGELWNKTRMYAKKKGGALVKASTLKVPSVQLLQPKEKVGLPPDLPKIERIPFNPIPENIERFDRLLAKAFNVTKNEAGGDIEPFELDTDDPWLKASIEELNEDYRLGAERNRQVPVFTLSGNISLEQLCTTHLEAISAHIKQSEMRDLSNRQSQLLEMANRLPQDPLEALRYQTAISSGRQEPLSMNDCVGLFLTGNSEDYRKATNLTSDQDINRLHTLVGEYIFAHNRTERYRAVEKSLKSLDKLRAVPHTDEQLKQALQVVAEELSMLKKPEDREHRLEGPENQTATFMVFEYVLGLTLREHQLQGIKDMTEVDMDANYRMRSKILQRIQGGGKSLVFGHIMALLKADGYHLSIHVAPTSAYQTSLYDMKQLSKQIFGQREHTFTFDDDPLKFTPQYLNSIKDTMTEAVVNRDYITVTNETLRAMRCKYLKTQYLIKKLPNGQQKDALRGSNAILRDILGTMRQRAIFTFDEVHLALDPTKELNMPYGEVSHPIANQCNLIADILNLACSAKDAEGQPVLDVNHSSQQTVAHRAIMKEAIVNGLLANSSWNIPGVREYLNGDTNDIPAALDAPDKHELATLVTLAHQMLADTWLTDRLDKNVDEAHGLTDTTPRVSNPFVASMKPARGAEFSDETVISINTIIAYLAKGLNEKQTIEFIKLSKQKAYAEKESRKDTDPDLSIQATETAKAFKAALDKPLFQTDPEKSDDVALIQKALLNGRSEAMRLLTDYVIEHELLRVELYEHQVCSNGQNTASMGQSFVAYSGSLENKNMAPIGSEIMPEVGTNGQTLDRLISQGTEVKVVRDSPEALFDDLISKHPRRADIRAIIDVGAIFRGVDNEEAARLICSQLVESTSDAKGVLFFHNQTEKLCFMHRDSPTKYTELSGSTPQVIKQETGLTPETLFTFYDQDHITGIDFKQMPNALAVLTLTNTTVGPSVFQGSRRMRELDYSQRIIVALAEGALEKINHALRTETKNPTIKHCLLYTHVQEALSQKPHNLLFALQKIENETQQYVLDRLYPIQDMDEHDRLFDQVSTLFDKDISTDLYRDYAHQRETVPMATYLENSMERFLSHIKGFFPEEEIEALRKNLVKEVLNEKMLKGMDKETLSPNTLNPNRETTRMQHREQAKDTEKAQANVQEQENIADYLKQVSRFRNRQGYSIEEIEFKKDAFFSPNFGTAEPEISLEILKAQQGKGQLVPKVWNLNQALAYELKGMPEGVSFDSRLSIMNHAGVALEGRTDLLGPIRKGLWPLLVIHDKATDEWKVVLCTIKQSLRFESWLKDQTNVLPEGREMWLLRPNGKLHCSREKYDSSMLENPHLKSLILQSLIFAGDFRSLSHKPWNIAFKEWVDSLTARERNQWANFFEQQVLMGKPPGYSSSRVHKLFRAEHPTT